MPGAVKPAVETRDTGVLSSGPIDGLSDDGDIFLVEPESIGDAGDALDGFVQEYCDAAIIMDVDKFFALSHPAVMDYLMGMIGEENKELLARICEVCGLDTLKAEFQAGMQQNPVLVDGVWYTDDS